MKRAINTDEIKEDLPEVDPIEEAKLALREVFDFSAAMEGNEAAFDKAMNNLINVVDEQAIHQIREEISVYYPEQLFSPVPYMSYRCGNLWYKTVVLPGETSEQAYDRAFAYLRDMVRKQFEECRREFWERHNSMSLS